MVQSQSCTAASEACGVAAPAVSGCCRSSNHPCSVPWLPIQAFACTAKRTGTFGGFGGGALEHPRRRWLGGPSPCECRPAQSHPARREEAAGAELRHCQRGPLHLTLLVSVRDDGVRDRLDELVILRRAERLAKLLVDGRLARDLLAVDVVLVEQRVQEVLTRTHRR